MIRNILWDVDGTLFDTYPAVTYTFSKILNEKGYSIPLNVIDGLVRQSFDNCVETLSQRFKLDPGLLRQKFAESYLTVSPANQPPFPGVSELCESIRQSGGHNLIVTQSSLESTKQLLEAHGLGDLFDGIVSVEHVDPVLVQTILNAYGLDSSETLSISSRDNALQPGKEMGTFTCLFGQKTFSHPTDFQIRHYNELLNIIEEQGTKESQ